MLGRRVLGISLVVIVLAAAAVYAGATASNRLYGDTLNWGLAKTVLFQSSLLRDAVWQTSAVKQLALLGCLLLLIGLVALFTRAAMQIATRLTDWTHVEAGRRRTNGLLAVVGGITLVAGAAAATLLAGPAPAVQGEPVTSFVGLVTATSLSGLDNARLQAAFVDGNTRKAYPSAPPKRPKNVVLILSDALRADNMSVYGYPRPTTPFLKRLQDAGQLQRVDRALSTCSESFCGISSTLASRPFHEISPGNFKLYELLRDVGYKINFFLTGDHWSWPYLGEFYGKDIDELRDYRSLKSDSLDDRPLVESVENMPASDGKPNFFYFFLMSSHQASRRVPELQIFQPVENGFTGFWIGLADRMRKAGRLVAPNDPLVGEEVDGYVNYYDNGLHQMDRMLERIFAALGTKGYLDDAMVVISGDHGEGLGEHGHIGHSRFLYQEDVGIPILIYDRDIGAYRNKTYGTMLDIAPTIVDRLGLPIPEGWQGRSLLLPDAPRLPLHQTRRGKVTCFAAVDHTETETWKYMRCLGQPPETRELLYELRSDPGERHSVMAARPDLAARLRAEVERRFSLVVKACGGIECSE